jgi:hypothetical protein
MGVSRTADGDYLSSVDVELLVTLCGYVEIVQNQEQNGHLHVRVRDHSQW